MHLTGWIPDSPDPRDLTFTAPSPAPLPSMVTLRHSPYQPPIWDQGALGSCTSFGIARVVEFARRLEGLPDFEPSHLFIYYNERDLEGTIGQDAGAQIRDGIKVVGKRGVCAEADWPYDVARFRDRPPDQAYTDAAGHLVVEYRRVSGLLNVKRCLADGYPVVLGFTCFASIEDATTAQTGVIPLPKRGEQKVGGHCVAATGYSDARQALEIPNSWSLGWGDQGYGWLPYGYVTRRLASDIWRVNLVR